MNATPSTSPISNNDKEKLLKDLKETFKDAWVIGKKLLQPVIGFISNKYESIPKEKQEKLTNLVATAKDCWEKGIWKIRELLGIIKK